MSARRKGANCLWLLVLVAPLVTGCAAPYPPGGWPDFAGARYPYPPPDLRGGGWYNPVNAPDYPPPDYPPTTRQRTEPRLRFPAIRAPAPPLDSSPLPENPPAGREPDPEPAPSKPQPVVEVHAPVPPALRPVDPSCGWWRLCNLWSRS